MLENILESLKIQSHNSGLSSSGSFKALPKGKLLASVNPSTESVLASVHMAAKNDCEQVIREASQDFEIWRTVPAPKRGEVVRVLGDRLRANKDLLGSLIALEMGKSKQEGDGEVQEMIDMADFACGLSRMLYGLSMHSERPEHRMLEQWHPLGLVGVITAFNFPMAVWAWNAFIAAVCGDIVIWKPSAKTPLCAIAVQHLCNQVMAELKVPSVFNLLIPQDHQVAEQLVDDKRLALISFTGSTKVGRQINERVAKRLGRCLLELGGNNAIIIDETADLNLAVSAVVFGAVGTAGQRCTSTRRVFVHNSKLEELKKRLVSAYQGLRIGDPLDTSMHMGPLIDLDAVKNYEHTIKELKKLGAKILIGGERLKRNGYFVQASIALAQADWPLLQEERFVPILYLISYDELSEAIRLQNAVPQGLSSALFTLNLRHAELFLSAKGSDCGISNINIGTSGAEIGGAFGGEKETGGGREAGSDAWKAYMRRQTNTINWGKSLPLAQGLQLFEDAPK